MTIQSAVAAELPFLRQEAEALMADTFTAYAPNPAASTTDANGFEVPGYTSEGTTKGKVAGPSAQSRDTQTRTETIGGVERLVIEGGLHIPVTAPVPTSGEYGKGWEYVVTAVGALSDLALLGSRWLVVDVPAKSYATARRLDVVRIS